MTDAPGGEADPFADWRGLAPAAARWHAAWALILVPLPLVAFLLAPIVAPDLDRDVARTAAFGLAVVLALNVVRTIVWFRRFRFRLTETTAETRSQVFTMTLRVVPLGRIQHVDVTAGPVERLLDVANVSAHTAAGDSTIMVPGVSAATAELFRERLLKERRKEAV